MKKLLMVVTMLCASTMALAQVNDGSLKYDFGGPISGFFLLGVGQCGQLSECAVTFNVIAGKFWNGELTGPDADLAPVGFDAYLQPQTDEGHRVHFQTGPLVSGSYDKRARFGRGGHFHLVSSSVPYLGCTSDRNCTYDGKWIWSRVRRTDLSDGSRVYEFDGELIGTYYDQFVGQLLKVRAHYHQLSGDWNNLLLTPANAQQSWSGGSLDVFTSGPQGAK